MNRSRREFLSLLGSAATAARLRRPEYARVADGVALAMGHPVQAMPQATPEVSDLQVRSNSILWDQERWGARLLRVNRAEVTHLIGYNGHAQGDVRLAEGDIEPRKVPYGFTSNSATLTWEAHVEHDSEYEVAILYHSGQEDNVGFRVELQCGSTSLATLARAPTDVAWKGGTPALPAFRREWLHGRLPLKRGVNNIALSVPEPTEKQVQLARKDLADPPNGLAEAELSRTFCRTRAA